MKYDFDKVIDRRNTNSEKYDFAKEWGVPQDALPMWVADMDFQTAPPIIKAMEKDLQLGIFGYSEPKEDYTEAVAEWFLKRHGWQLQPQWLVKTPGVVFAVAMAIRSITEKQDAILIQPPVYYPFKKVIEDNDRVCINNPLVNKNGHYEIDFADMERKIMEHKVKLFILCSPHNPGGRVWKKEELIKMAALCKKYGVFIVSDEIHADFTYPGYSHTVLAAAAKEYQEQMIICTSPSKTFNLAGLQISNIMIPNEEVRKRFVQEMLSLGYSELGMLSLSACKAAYLEGEEWLEELLKYLQSNLNYMRTFLAANLPKVKMMEPEGTYLVWLDFSEYGMSGKDLDQKILREGRLWLDAGGIFGEEGEQFERVNIACPRSTLVEAMQRLAKAFQ